MLLLWPAFWNVYPLVFSDTGTYLTQAIHRYLGWDRPVFYSLFLYPLHLQRTLWPPIVAQAVLAAWLLHLLRRVLLPDRSAWALLVLGTGLTVLTALPFVASQLMPDVFTSLLVIAISLTVLTPERLSRTEAGLLLPITSFMIAAHQSHVLLAAALLPCVLMLRHPLGAAPRPPDRGPVCLRVWGFACRCPRGLALARHSAAAVGVPGFGLGQPDRPWPGLAVAVRQCLPAGQADL